MGDPIKVHARLMAAFPWFDEEAWAWHYEEGEPPASGADPLKGKIAIYMPGASPEQQDAVTAWLTHELQPSGVIPGPVFVADFASVASSNGSR